MPVDVLGGTAIRPVERKGMEAVSYFLFNPETGQIMGRTPMSWLLITVFYIVYYAFLAAFWALCLFVFFSIGIEEKSPYWTTKASLIGESPAMGVRPGQAWELIDSSMIIFNTASRNKVNDIPGWEEWADRTKTFLEPYADVNQTELVLCGDRKNDNEVCKFPISTLGPCGKGNFGYDMGKPCIYLKLNKIFGLEHKYYNTVESLPDYTPARVGQKMKELPATKRNQVWVHCHGENAADREAMGRVKYYPDAAGFEGKYFPYFNQDGYISPLIAVQFMDATPGQLLHIECRAYAGNIKYDKRDKLGRAHFELLIHNAQTAP